MVQGDGIEPPSAGLQPAANPSQLTLHCVAPPERFELSKAAVETPLASSSREGNIDVVLN